MAWKWKKGNDLSTKKMAKYKLAKFDETKLGTRGYGKGEEWRLLLNYTKAGKWLLLSGA